MRLLCSLVPRPGHAGGRLNRGEVLDRMDRMGKLPFIRVTVRGSVSRLDAAIHPVHPVLFLPFKPMVTAKGMEEGRLGGLASGSGELRLRRPEAVPVESRGLAEVPIKAAQTERDKRDQRDESNLIKPSQTESNLPWPTIGLRVGKMGGGMQACPTQSKPVKPGGFGDYD